MPEQEQDHIALPGPEVPDDEVLSEENFLVSPMRVLPIVSRTENTIVRASDERSKGGAPVVYFITDNNDEILDSIRFTNRPVTEGGFNGVTNEDLTGILIHRLRSFQAGEYPCNDNDQAILFFKMALDALEARTHDRKERNVEGKYAS